MCDSNAAQHSFLCLELAGIFPTFASVPFLFFSAFFENAFFGVSVNRRENLLTGQITGSLNPNLLLTRQFKTIIKRV